MFVIGGQMLMFILRKVVPKGNNAENQTYKMFPTGTTICKPGRAPHNFDAAKNLSK